MEPRQKPGRSFQNYATPREFFDAVERVYGKMNFDLAADEHNTKAGSYYYDEGIDSLKQDWTKLKGNLWLNPPFGDIAPWARKCLESCSFTAGRLIFLLTPASVGTDWFERYVHGYARVLPLLPRLSFDGRSPYPKDLMMSLFGVPPGFTPWRWRA
jgi:phage N-6-adenine-methyltransferase